MMQLLASNAGDRGAADGTEAGGVEVKDGDRPEVAVAATVVVPPTLSVAGVKLTAPIVSRAGQGGRGAVHCYLFAGAALSRYRCRPGCTARWGNRCRCR